MIGIRHHGSGGGDYVLDRLEECLTAAGEGTKINISMAKKVLKEKGAAGHAIAARLGRLSKVRDGRALPDVSLAADIEAFCRAHERMRAPWEHPPLSAVMLML